MAKIKMANARAPMAIMPLDQSGYDRCIANQPSLPAPGGLCAIIQNNKRGSMNRIWFEEKKERKKRKRQEDRTSIIFPTRAMSPIEIINLMTFFKVS